MVSPPGLSQKVENEKIDLLQLIRIRLSEKVHNFGYVVHVAPSEAARLGSDKPIIERLFYNHHPQIYQNPADFFYLLTSSKSV